MVLVLIIGAATTRWIYWPFGGLYLKWGRGGGYSLAAVMSVENKQTSSDDGSR